MPSLAIGLEDGNLLLNGMDAKVSVKTPIVITAYQISFSDLVFSNMEVMVLGQIAIVSNPQFTGKPSDYLVNLDPNPDFGPVTIDNPNASQIGYGIGGTGMLWSGILKDANGNSANQAVALSGIKMPAKPGQFLVAHMDGGGSPVKITDGEIQGCIFYEYAT